MAAIDEELALALARNFYPELAGPVRERGYGTQLARVLESVGPMNGVETRVGHSAELNCLAHYLIRREGRKSPFLDFVRFQKLRHRVAVKSAWAELPWHEEVKTIKIPRAEGWRLADQVGVGCFFWGWDRLRYEDACVVPRSAAGIWLILVRRDGREHVDEIEPALGRWLSSYGEKVRRTNTDRQPANADQELLANALRLQLIVQ